MSNIVTADELQEFFSRKKDTISYKIIESPIKDKKFRLKIDSNFNTITKIMEDSSIRIEGKVPVLSDYSDVVIDAAVWLMYTVEEPKLDFDTALSIAELSGFWTATTIKKIKAWHGITEDIVEEVEASLDKDPLEE